MVNTKKIKARMIEKDKNIQKLAPKVGYTAYTLGRMISNKTAMTLDVSKVLMIELDILDEEIPDFFYQ